MKSAQAKWMADLNPFELETRCDDGERFWTLKVEAYRMGWIRGWIRGAVYDAHFDAMPEDWTFRQCAMAWDAYQRALEEGRSEEWIHPHADSEMDVYTRHLMQWVADHCLGGLYSEAEERAKDLGLESGTIEARVIQYSAIVLVCEVMQRAIDTAWEEHNADAT